MTGDDFTWRDRVGVALIWLGIVGTIVLGIMAAAGLCYLYINLIVSLD